MDKIIQYLSPLRKVLSSILTNDVTNEKNLYYKNIISKWTEPIELD